MSDDDMPDMITRLAENLPPRARVSIEIVINGGIAIARDAEGLAETLPQMAAKVQVEAVAMASAALHARGGGEACPFTHSHTGDWCGYASCRESG